VKHSLALSLGHNSSAIYIRDGQIIAGYEEERFTGVKADSHFPMLSINELVYRYNLPKDTDTYVGHWFIDARLPSANKYWDPSYINLLFPNGEINSLSPDFTHHDSHLLSAQVFAGGDFAEEYTAVVADGFGSFGECITIYEVKGRKFRLVNRVYGFEKSMGMLYQYATAFMGMKMHNHEYKMLAYEVHITEVLDAYGVEKLQQLVHKQAGLYLKSMHDLKITSQYDPVTKIEALPNVQALINDMLTGVLKEVSSEHDSEYNKRVIISYFVQNVVEQVIVTLVKLHNPTNLMVVGGLFYNVKINHILANLVPGKFTAMPLAGDQGASLGVYQAYQGDLVWPENLAWGDRDLKFDTRNLPRGMVVCNTEEEAQKQVMAALHRQGFCNLVRGRMEYGPRALCNTSTIAIPDLDVAKSINHMNARTMEMPFAPVVTKEQADQIFIGYDKIHKSLEYMIATRTYRPGEAERMMGAAHFYPQEGVFTGRPQVTAEPFMVQMLNEFGPLVNTSFNFHGVPIVRSEEQILDTHIREWQAAPKLEPTTVILRS
jgi:predicted NodU family carbamoyl transferase